MMAIYIHNSQTHKKEEFIPIEPNKVKMYLCGPTVYDFLHVGNFRGPIFFNLVRNWFEESGYQVTFVYNYTDVDDKIIDRAKKEGKSAEEISEAYIREFEKDFKALKLRPHSYNPKVTEYLNPIVQLIEQLIERKHAYVVDGEVLFSIESFPSYGKLSGRNPEELLAGARVEVDQKKRNPLDFALWKPAKGDEISWDSPWGKGRPGWHIECSAMARTILGDSIDLHCGGMDLIFPHHENEIAQSEGATGKTFVKYWMHNNMLTFGNQKMSKSLGNIRTARNFLEQYDPEILKFLMLSAHYRSLNSFSEEHIAQTIAGLARLYSSMAWAESLSEKSVPELKPHEAKKIEGFTQVLAKAQAKIVESLNDDFNTPEVFAAMFEVTREYNALARSSGAISSDRIRISKDYLEWMRRYGKLMSLFQEPARTFLTGLDDLLLKNKGLSRSDIDKKVDERSQARKDKNFQQSDLIRDELVRLGIAVQDTPEGSVWEVSKS